MDILIAVAATALLIWLFLRQNTSTGNRTVAAFVFLKALEDGRSVEEARAEADKVGKKPEEVLIRQTWQRLKDEYRGRHRALLQDAERKGFRG